MAIRVPDEWLASPPEILVIGNGPFAMAFAQILMAARVAADEILGGLQPGGCGASRVLDDLRRVFIVAESSQASADLLCVEEAFWRWIEVLTADKEQHRVAVQFILPPQSFADYVGSLALGLSCHRLDPGSTGHGASSMADGLAQILTLSTEIQPKDQVALWNRRISDQYRSVLSAFERAVGCDDFREAQEAAEAVTAAFVGREYRIDLFCRPPCHSNGNRLRSILNEIVTGSVTPTIQKALFYEGASLLR